MWDFIGGIFSASIGAGILMGLDIVYTLARVINRGWSLIWHPIEGPYGDNILVWIDVVLSITLLSVAFAHPSVTVILTVANWVVRLYLLWEGARRKGINFTNNKYYAALAKAGEWVKNTCNELIDAFVDGVKSTENTSTAQAQ